MTMRPVWHKSYVEGVPTQVDVPNLLLGQELEGTANQFPGNTALHLVLKYLPLGIAIQSQMTYRELDLATNRFARALRSLGVKPGDRVGIMLPNTPAYVIAFFGISKAGCVVVNANPIFTASELSHLFADSNAKAVVCMSGGLEKVKSFQSETEIEHIIISDINDSIGGIFGKLAAKSLKQLGHIADVTYGNGVYSFDMLVRQETAAPIENDAEPDDMAILQYTSGTTGLPKAAVLSHNNILTNVSMCKEWMVEVTPGKEVILGALPYFHVFGLVVGVLLNVRLGGRLVITPNPRDTEQNLKMMDKEKPTIFPGVPAMYNAIVNHEDVEKYDVQSIRYCISGGAPLPLEVQERFARISGGLLVEGYGMTECTAAAVANPLGGVVKNGTIGTPMPSTEIRIVSFGEDDTEAGEDVVTGVRGELLLRGPHVMREYWRNPEETAATLDSEGWLHTGDLAVADEDGYLTLVDRKKDLIIVSGFNVVPREVEEVLYKHDSVLEAAVAGLPDAHSGEIVKAYVVAKPGKTLTAEQVLEHCRQELAPYKVPKEVAFKEELPKTLVGKILRRALVEADMQS
jgi:long-chain acyl-CoA synthetase